MGKFICSLFVCLLFILIPKQAYAITDPLSSPNNIFGIHILNEGELKDAANLVNSGGGDWGYVTLVIQKGERDQSRWQRAFNEARRLHLIPIVRIASSQQNSGWEKPSVDEIDGWVSFLNSLNWVSKNRYVVVANEPNHAKEWGGEINPGEYAKYLRLFSEKLKANSPDFFVLPAGFDFSAKNTKDTMEATTFLKEAVSSEKDFFNYIDGWTSHSYPNPDFAGSEYASGRGTVKSFEWELEYLKTLGLGKELPVFITETGWAHDGDGGLDGGVETNKVGSKLTYAFTNPWKNPKVVAVTPFVLNYQTPPFDVFSWKKPEGTFYDFYQEVQKLPKTRGQPERIASASITATFRPLIIRAGSEFYVALFVSNFGQTILNEETILTLNEVSEDFETIQLIYAPQIEPFHSALMIFKLKAQEASGLMNLTFELNEGDKSISNLRSFNIFSLGI